MSFVKSFDKHFIFETICFLLIPWIKSSFIKAYVFVNSFDKLFIHKTLYFWIFRQTLHLSKLTFLLILSTRTTFIKTYVFLSRSQCCDNNWQILLSYFTTFSVQIKILIYINFVFYELTCLTVISAG